MPDAHAKSTGTPGVFSAAPGLGVLNAGAAICTARGGNAPVRRMTGKAPSPVKAPWDELRQKGVAPRQALAPRRHIAPVADAIARAAQVIARARNPLIMVGGGAPDAAAEALALARRIGAPAASHRSGKGIVPDDDPHAMNLITSRDYLRDRDLLIGIGSRLELQDKRRHKASEWLPNGPIRRPPWRRRRTGPSQRVARPLSRRGSETSRWTFLHPAPHGRRAILHPSVTESGRNGGPPRSESWSRPANCDISRGAPFRGSGQSRPMIS